MRSLPTQLRKDIQSAAQNGDIAGLRISIDALYGESSPFKDTPHHMTATTMNPIIEAAILSKLSSQQPIFEELVLDIKHLHRALGVTENEYAHITEFLDTVEGPRQQALNSAKEHFKSTRYHKLKFIHSDPTSD